MINEPTGRLTGTDLSLTRVFRAGIDDVWASITESDRTARWFGAWTGEAGAGRTIKVQMAFEEGQPWMDARIAVCEPPRRLAVSTSDDAGDWHLELLLTSTGDHTELKLVHHLETTEGIGDIGPGWEYYLDNLVAARGGTALPDFADYYPAMKPYFEALRDA